MLKRVMIAVVAAGFLTQALPAAKARDGQPQVTCPVTGKPVKDLNSAPKSEYKGKTYYFCCPSCKEKFDKDPEKYVGKGQQGAHEGHEHSCSGASGCGHQAH